MNTKHTPGPWRHEMCHGTNYARIFMFPDSSDSLAGYCGEDNARLVAAAPDLLEALQGLLTDIVEYQTINKLGGENNHWQVIARAAIAKATGETK